MSIHRIMAVSLGAALLAGLAAEAHADQDKASHKQHKKQDKQQSPGNQAAQGETITPLESTLHFEFDSAALDADAKKELDQLVVWLEENPQRTVIVAGHSDRQGAEEYNLLLGNDRAKQTKDYLVNKGIAAERIITLSFGEEFPVSNEPAENRRTVFYTTRLKPGQVAGAIPEQNRSPLDQQGQAGMIQQDQSMGATGEQSSADTRGGSVAGSYGAWGDEERAGESAEHLLTPHGLAVSVGGGVINFLDGDARGFTSAGGAWDVRLVYGTRLRIAGELAYFGSAQDIDPLGLDDNAMLLGSGLEANARVNVLRVNRFQPYLFGGVGWTYYDVVNEGHNFSNVRDDEDHLHIPFGLGVGFRMYGFLADVRGTMRAAVGDNLVGEPGTIRDDIDVITEQPDLSTWGLTAKLGWEF